MKKIMILLLFITLTSCGTTKLVYKDRIVKVPVAVFKEPPAAPEVKQPIYELNNITKDSTQDDVAKAYVITVKQLTDYINRLKIALKPYQKKQEK